jgi:hypothetical protein
VLPTRTADELPASVCNVFCRTLPMIDVLLEIAVAAGLQQGMVKSVAGNHGQVPATRAKYKQSSAMSPTPGGGLEDEKRVTSPGNGRHYNLNI